jgi:hypothetical protein
MQKYVWNKTGECTRRWEDKIILGIKNRIGGFGMDILILGHGPVTGYVKS